MSEPSRPRDIVLVVDDSPDTLRLLTDALEQAGVLVLVATSGTQALALVERITPDIILMDAVMPGVDGFETCRRLKATGPVSHVPVIFMTGLSETQHIIKGLEAGGVDYLTKPIVIDELLARIRVHLANARAAQSARIALDAAGRYLLAADSEGRVLWSTPQAIRLLGTSLMATPGTPVVPPDVMARVMRGPADNAAIPLSGIVPALHLAFLGRISENEYLFRLTASAGDQAPLLKQRFQLTTREAEVLLWIGRGKSNRDIGEILGLSPRTVNKHLEQIYVKLGVENRASAAVIASRALDER